MQTRLVSFLLRTGLAIAFLYAAIASFLEPISWIGFFPAFLRELLPAEILLMVFSVYELGLALWLLSGKASYYAGLLSAATLAGIIVFNLGALDIIFRDIAILASALALVALEKPEPSSA
jgi:hypothetical protein